jgi:hypothetical protein
MPLVDKGLGMTRGTTVGIADAHPGGAGIPEEPRRSVGQPQGVLVVDAAPGRIEQARERQGTASPHQSEAAEEERDAVDPVASVLVVELRDVVACPRRVRAFGREHVRPRVLEHQPPALPQSREVEDVVVGDDLEQLAPGRQQTPIPAVRLPPIRLREQLVDPSLPAQLAQVLDRAVGAAAVGDHHLFVRPHLGEQTRQRLAQIGQLVARVDDPAEDGAPVHGPDPRPDPGDEYHRR